MLKPFKCRKLYGNKIAPTENPTTPESSNFISSQTNELESCKSNESKNHPNKKLEKIIRSNLESARDLNFLNNNASDFLDNIGDREEIDRFHKCYGETVVKNLLALENRISNIFSSLFQGTWILTSNPYNTPHENRKNLKYKMLFTEFDLILRIISASLAVANKRKIMKMMYYTFLQNINSLSKQFKSLHGIVKKKRMEIKILKNQIYLLKKIFEDEFPKSRQLAKCLNHDLQLNEEDFVNSATKTSQLLPAEGTMQFKINSNDFSILSHFPESTDNNWTESFRIPELGLTEIINGLFYELTKRTEIANRILSSNISSGKVNSISLDDSVEELVEKLFRLANFRGMQIRECDSTRIIFTIYKLETMLIKFKDNLVQTLFTLGQLLQRIKFMKACIDARRFKNDLFCDALKNSTFQIQLYTKWHPETQVFISKLITDDELEPPNQQQVSSNENQPLGVAGRAQLEWISCAKCSKHNIESSAIN